MMAISTREIKNAVKEALAERYEGGIQPIVFPPLAETPNEISTTVRTEEVVASLLRHKQYARKKEETSKTYRNHLYRFAR